MNYSSKVQSQIVLTFIWIGFVCAISFMEAWLKFRAPGITIPLGLGIGRLVFAALNKVEWVLAVGIGVSVVLNGIDVKSVLKKYYLFLIPITLLIVQTVWVLPQLSLRSEKIIHNVAVEHSNLHFYFVGMELIKIACLFIWGIHLLRDRIYAK